MSRAKQIRPEVRDLISLAERTPGWRVEIKVKRAEFHGPGGVIIPVTLMSDDRDLRQVNNKFRRAGLLPQEGNGATVSDLVTRPIIGKNYDQMSTDEKAMYVWTVARDFAIAANCDQVMEEGALYYIVKDKSIVDFIRVAFPDVDKYEQGARPNDSGMRPIYDYLRSHALVVRKGQQANPMEGNGVCIADSSNPNKIKSEHRQSKAAEKRAARPERPKNGPVITTRRATVQPAKPEEGWFIRSHSIGHQDRAHVWLVTKVEGDVVTLRSAVNGRSSQALISHLGPFERVTYGDLPMVGTMLRKPTGKTVFEVREPGTLSTTVRVLTRPGNAGVGVENIIFRDELRKYVMVNQDEFEALRRENTPAPEIVRPMPEDERSEPAEVVAEEVTETLPEPESEETVPVLVPKAEPTSTAVEEFMTGLDLLRQTAESLVAAQTGPDPVVEAQMAELRRDVAFERAQAAHQRARAERAEATLKQLREVIENKAPKDAYPEIVRLVPPFPEDGGLTVVS